MEKNKQQKYVQKMKEKGKSRINAYISNENYNFIDELMEKEDLISLPLSKGFILDLALTNLVMSLDSGESLDNIAIKHLKRVG